MQRVKSKNVKGVVLFFLALFFVFGFGIVARAAAYEILLSPTGTYTFPAATVGYGAQTAKTATITNIGTSATGQMGIVLTGTDASSFTLSKTTQASLSPGGGPGGGEGGANNEGNFTVVPITSLAAKTYTATVTVGGGPNNVPIKSFNVSFTVNAASYTITKTAPTNGSFTVPTSGTYGSTITISSITPAAGYSIGTVSVKRNDTGAAVTVSGSGSSRTFTMPASAVTVSITFTANTTSVTLDRNGGTSGSASVTATYGSAMPAISTPIFTGHTFTGYWDATSGGTQYYTSSGASARTWDKTGSTATLYARWTANTYPVTYSANGGTGAPASQTKTHGVNLTLSSTKPTWTGYTFQGWGLTSSAVFPYYQPGDTYVNNAALDLFAVWAANKYNVTNSVSNATITNTGANAATHGVAWSGTLNPSNGYTRPASITMTRSGSNFANFSYTQSTGAISIAATYVTGHFVINGSAAVNITKPVISRPKTETALFKSNISVDWSATSGATYKISLQDTTVNMYALKDEFVSTNSYTINKKYLYEGHAYKITVTTISGGQELTADPVEIYIDLSQARRDVLARAKAMVDYRWEPTQNLIGWREFVTYKSGYEYGIPYTWSPRSCSIKSVPWDCAEEDGQCKIWPGRGFDATYFEDHKNDSGAEGFYEPYIRDVGSIKDQKMPRYGNECSGFVSIAYNIHKEGTSTIPGSPYIYSIIPTSNTPTVEDYARLSPGDIVNSSSGGHVIMVKSITPVIGSDGKTSFLKILSLEQQGGTSPYVPKSIYWDFSQTSNNSSYKPMTKNHEDFIQDYSWAWKQ